MYTSRTIEYGAQLFPSLYRAHRALLWICCGLDQHKVVPFREKKVLLSALHACNPIPIFGFGLSGGGFVVGIVTPSLSVGDTTISVVC